MDDIDNTPPSADSSPASHELDVNSTALGDLTFALIRANVDDFLTVTDAELLKTMFFLWERMKIVVEPTGSLAACALLEKKLDAKGKRVGVVLSGGNVDLAWAAGRLLRTR